MVTTQQAEAILDAIAAHGWTIRRACDEQMVDRRSFARYRVAAGADFEHRLSIARRAAMDHLIDAVHGAVAGALGDDIDVASKPLVSPAAGPATSTKATGPAVARVPDPALLRAGIDGALRLASKVDPDRYGDRLDLKVTAPLPLAAVLTAADARAGLLEAQRASRRPVQIEQLPAAPRSLADLI